MSSIPAGTAFVDVEGRFDNLRRQVMREGDLIGQSLGQRIRQSLDRTGQSLQRTGMRLATRVTLPLVALGSATVKAASDVEEMESKFRAVFQELSGDVERWAADHADSVNRSRFDLMGYLATLQDTFVPMGFARDEAAELSQTMVALAVDLASFNNMAEPEVVNLLTSALVGNHRAVQRFGVVINQAALEQELLNMGIAGGVREASEQEKMMARLNIILASTADAQGDAERTAGSFANQMRGARAAGRDLAVAIGQQLLPMATGLMERFADLFSNLSEVNPELLRMGVIIAGIAAAAGPGLLLVGTALRGISLLLSPGALLLGGLALLAAGFVHAFGKGDTFLAKVVDIGSRLRDWFAPIIERARGWLSDLGGSFGDTRIEAEDSFTRMAATISTESGNIQTSIRDRALSAMTGLRNWMDRNFPNMLGFVKTFADGTEHHMGEVEEVFGDFRQSLEDNRVEMERTKREGRKEAGRFAQALDRIFGDIISMLGGQRIEWGSFGRFMGDFWLKLNQGGVGTMRTIADVMEGIERVTRLALQGMTAIINSMFIDPINRLIGGVNRVLDAIGSNRSIPALARLIPPRNPIVSTGVTDRISGGLLARAHTGWRVGEEPPPQTTSLDRPLAPDEEMVVVQHGERILSRAETNVFERGQPEQGDFLERALAAGKALAERVRETATAAIRRVVERLRDLVGSIAVQSPGGVIGDALASLVRQAVQAAGRWARGIEDNLVPDIPVGGGVSGPAGRWQQMWAAVRNALPFARLTSAYRPGAITATGNRSYHGMGRAIDIAGRGSMNFADMGRIFEWIRSNYPNATELIYSPAGGRQLWRGRNHFYSGITRANHWDHVHWAMGDGGIVRKDGRFLVGENGAEVVNLNRGDYVQPLSHTMQPVEVHFHGDVYGVDGLGRRVAEALNVASRHGTRLHPRVVAT